MTTIHHAHERTSPSNVKKTAVRAQRPTPLTRTGSSRTVSKGAKAKRQADSVVDDEEEDDDDMAASFLQFCAMCEKQIIVPNNSILYCSESCRRKDCTPPPTGNAYIAIMSPVLSPYKSFGCDLIDPLGSKVKELIPRLQPTVLPENSSRIPTLSPSFTSDLDPTEWKPELEARTSEAFHYLSQFHHSASSLHSSRRPVLARRSRTITSTNTTPSLSHTPSSASSREASPVGTPYDFATRPLPPRHDPASYSAAVAAKSVELVTPHPYTFSVPAKPSRDDTTKEADAASAVIGHLSYEKKMAFASSGTPGAENGGLKQLLGVEDLGGKLFSR